MIISIWFEDVGGHHEAKVFDDVNNNDFEIILPAVDDDVGIWKDDFTEGTDAFPLLKVSRVRHYFFEKDGSWNQEIHVMCENR